MWSLLINCLQEVFNAFSVVAIRFATDAFNFFDLACFASSLDVLEVHLWILAKVDDWSQKVEQTFKTLNNDNIKLHELYGYISIIQN